MPLPPTCFPLRPMAGCAHARPWWVCLAWLFLVIGPAAAADGPWRVGVLYWSSDIPGQVAMRMGLEAEAVAINRRARLSGAREVRLEPR
ncbi:MAG TPA: hypothetical protein VN436_02735, partial [Holophaga sp.]|nr:hypothetical protein [Holophaga sp.]